MLHFSRQKTAAILLTVLVVCLFVVPDFIARQDIQNWPKWAQHHILLGLDLRGGSYLLLQVDSHAVRKEMAGNLEEDVRRRLREARIGYHDLHTQNGAVEVRFTSSSELARARRHLDSLVHPLSGLLGSTGQDNIQISATGHGWLRLAPTDAAVTARVHRAAQQSIPIIGRRVNALGTVEPTIESEGANRIVVEVPGLKDPTRLKKLLGKTAKLTFQLVDPTISAAQALQQGPPPGSEILYDTKSKPPIPYLVKKHVAVSGADLTDAQAGFDSRTDQPIVSFRFNAEGARRFAEITRKNVGRPFAIVLDNKVISAPVIREPILGGSGEISGHFTVREANDLAILLRAGALPAPLTTIEQRTVGPGLGKDSIRAGEAASLVGSAFVVLFMLATYGLFGLFADLAVAINVLMIFGVMSLLDATLTLPGIAGVVLTVGIAVDSNVLIYERIREEARHGRPAIAAIDAGFKRALATILDSNITTLIAAAVLYFIGSGPVRGFAVTLGIGIMTSLFTAFTLSRLIISWWVEWSHPKTVPV